MRGSEGAALIFALYDQEQNLMEQLGLCRVSLDWMSGKGYFLRGLFGTGQAPQGMVVAPRPPVRQEYLDNALRDRVRWGILGRARG